MAGRFFDRLVYSLGDEDTSVELGILPEDSQHVVCVAGSGGRVLPLLARRPRRLTCVDISPVQLAITEMRLAALGQLGFDDYLGLLGLPPATMTPDRRRDCFESLDMCPDRAGLLRDIFAASGWSPIIYLGRFERMLMQMAPVVRLLLGRHVRRLFEHDTLAEQRDYHARAFPHRRWTIALAILGNAPVLNALLYRGAFPRKNIAGSAYSFYRRRFEHLFQHCVTRESFFLQLLFWRRLRFPEGNPLEGRREVFEAAKQNLAGADVRFVQGDLIETIRGAGRAVDFCSLSDVPSFLDAERETRFLQDIRPALDPGAVVVTRGHLRVPRPDTAGYRDITRRYDALLGAETTQLWHTHIYACQRAA